MRQAVSIIPSVLPRRARVSARQSDPAACRGTRGNGASWPARRRARCLSRALYPHATDRPLKLSTNRGGSTVCGARGLAQPDPAPGGRVRERERNAGPFLPLAGRYPQAQRGRRSRTGALREAIGAFWPRGASIPSDRPAPASLSRALGDVPQRRPKSCAGGGGGGGGGAYGTEPQAPSTEPGVPPVRAVRGVARRAAGPEVQGHLENAVGAQSEPPSRCAPPRVPGAAGPVRIREPIAGTVPIMRVIEAREADAGGASADQGSLPAVGAIWRPYRLCILRVGIQRTAHAPLPVVRVNARPGIRRDRAGQGARSRPGKA